MTRKVTPEHKDRAERLPNPNPNRDVDVIDAYEPTPPPRCRVLVEGKPCGKPDVDWMHVMGGAPRHEFKEERRVSGERRCARSLSPFPMKYYEPQNRRVSDRRKAGKL